MENYLLLKGGALWEAGIKRKGRRSKEKGMGASRFRNVLYNMRGAPRPFSLLPSPSSLSANFPASRIGLPPCSLLKNYASFPLLRPPLQHALPALQLLHHRILRTPLHEGSTYLADCGALKMSSLGQLLMTGVPGYELDTASAVAFRRIQPGAFILFGRNIQSPAQLRKLCDDLRDLSDVEPIITIDQEGGRVSRLKLIGNEPPNANQLRDKDDLSLIEMHGRTTGKLLRMFGFNLDLCPVLDISFDDEADNSLRGRCYGNNPAQVIRNAGAFNSALQAEGILTCGKHFPGYSRCPEDAHHELPTVSFSKAELDAQELSVFRYFADKVDSMMIGHAFYPALDDSGVPTSLSSKIIGDLLRVEHGFGGLVMTDDLDMGAILNPYGKGDDGLEQVIHRAINAGNDIAMICHRVEMVEKALGFLIGADRTALDRALANVAAFKKKLTPPDVWDEAEFRRRDTEVWDLRAATLGAKQAALRSPEDGKRSPVEMY